MADKKVVDLSAKRVESLLSTDSVQGMKIMGDLLKETCGIDLLRVVVMMKMVEPLLRIERQDPANFEKKRKEYLAIIRSYDASTYLPLLNNSPDGEWKRRPIFFQLLVEKAFHMEILDF